MPYLSPIRATLGFLCAHALIVCSITIECRAQDKTAVAPRNYALLVAVTEYNHSLLNTLKYPEEDAKAIEVELKKGGYEVDTLLRENATAEAIQKKLAGLSKKGNAPGAVVIGFFGHGVEYEGTSEAMFCPYDTTLRIAKDADGNELRETEEKGGGPLLEPDPKSLIGMQSILKALRLCPAGNKLLVADCCRSRPNTARGRAFGSAFKMADLPENTAALFACEAGQEAHEHDDWKHGALTLAFLQSLPELSDGQNDINAITGRMSKRIAKMVSDVTKGEKKQTMKSLVSGIVELKLQSSLPQEIVNTIGLQLRRIPAARHVLGYVYYLGTYEVTQEQYQQVMGNNPSKNQARKNLPVEQVSFFDAMEFCKRLTERESKAGTLPAGLVYRLPWKKEWEAAAIDSGSRFSERTLLSQGWFKESEDRFGTRIVGLKPANALGIHDLFGNVAEMCLDTEPDDKSGEPLRNVVGGSWFDAANKIFSEPASSWIRQESFYNYQGFRVALAPPADAETVTPGDDNRNREGSK